jgi:diacylglycerol kinase
MGRKRKKKPSIVASALNIVHDARGLRDELAPQWTKNRSPWRGTLAAFKGLVFWNTLEHNKVGRLLPYHAAVLGTYVGIDGLLLKAFSWVELGILLFASIVWFAVEVINTAFEYLLDELHGRHFDERHAHIKDMGGGAAVLVSLGMGVLLVAFCLP